MLVKMGSSSPRFGVKIRNIWNHHLDDVGTNSSSLSVKIFKRLYKSLKKVYRYTFRSSCACHSSDCICFSSFQNQSLIEKLTIQCLTIFPKNHGISKLVVWRSKRTLPKRESNDSHGRFLGGRSSNDRETVASNSQFDELGIQTYYLYTICQYNIYIYIYHIIIYV